MHLVLDIETIPDASMPEWPKAAEGKFPPAPFWEIITIGVLTIEKLQMELMSFHEGTEADMLHRFVDLFEDHKPTLVSWNGRRFDLPVIIARCMRHGIPIPTYFKYDGYKQLYRYRYGVDALHFDVADRIIDFGAGQGYSLDAASRMIGLPGKLDVNGADVHELYKQGQLDRISAYCLQDVVQTAFLLFRLSFIEGKLTPDNYLKVISSLWDLCSEDKRVEAIVNGADYKRIMLKTSDAPAPNAPSEPSGEPSGEPPAPARDEVPMEDLL